MYNKNMLEDIKIIIKAGTQAPSGDNVQPWRFVVNDSVIKLFNVPEADNSFYNISQNASYIAHGAVIENMAITAKTLGYNANISLFPDSGKSNLVATISLEKGNTQNQPLYEYIEKRVTNRKPYTSDPLNDEQKNNILSCANEFKDARILIADDTKDVKKLAQILSLNEQIVLENKQMHDFLFSHVVWSEEEERQKKRGLYIKTLELKKPQEKMFGLVKNFTILRFLNRLIGISKKVSKENGKVYAQSSAIIAVSTNGDTKESYIKAGQLMQKVWLTVAKSGLSAGPLMGVILLSQMIRGGSTNDLSQKHINLLNRAYVEIKNIFRIKDDTIKVILRVGRGDEPSAYSSRRDPNITF
ncbi:hypothetical protein HON59_00855 [bacterium]|jgi:hypothetical protein|nr:hypothetical protein [bacterium]MBT3730189.1 hypothetical protein [bacterium]MBT4894601.1 hypothetical protein [bacterium]